MPHPNSLMYNVYVIPFLPMKVYWTLAKVSQSSLRMACLNTPILIVGSEHYFD